MRAMAPDKQTAEGRGKGLSASAVSWAFLESGRTTYTVLIAVYVFTPYLAAVLVGDPVKGQSVVAQMGQWAGIAGAFIAPLLGTTIDHLGRRKVLLTALSLTSVPLCFALWFAARGMMSIAATAEIISITGLVFSIAEVVQNSMLVFSAKEPEQATASGLAYAFGNAVSTLMMMFVLWAFVLPATMHASWLPAKPLLGLNPATHEPERITGPLCGLVMLVGILPFALFSKDGPKTGISVGKAVRMGARDLMGLLGLLREAPNARMFLFARMIFADAQGGIVMFTGVFAAGVLGWGPAELMVEGLVASVFAALGGLLAGWLDPRIGAKRSLFITLGGCLACIFLEIGVGKDHIFWLAYNPAINGRPWSLPIFDTWPDWMFIAADFGMSVFVVSAFASSRTLMAQLAPPGRTAAFFGLFALSGRATAWLCPAAVGAATVALHSQQLGYLPVAGMLAIGIAMMVFVKGTPVPQQADGRAGPLEALLESPPRVLIPEPWSEEHAATEAAATELQR